MKQKGYFTSEAGLEEGSFRLLHSSEMAEKAFDRIVESMTKNFVTAHVMSNHDITTLDETQQKKHNAMQLKAANIALIQNKMIFQDKEF
jgi:hypothetical protein